MTDDAAEQALVGFEPSEYAGSPEMCRQWRIKASRSVLAAAHAGEAGPSLRAEVETLAERWAADFNSAEYADALKALLARAAGDGAEVVRCPVCDRDPSSGGEHWYDHAPAAQPVAPQLVTVTDERVARAEGEVYDWLNRRASDDGTDETLTVQALLIAVRAALGMQP